MRNCRAPARRGVLLLIILALLAMFGLVAVAFVVVTGHSMRSAQAIQRIGQSDTRPEEDLHQAFLQVVRGPTNPGSRMGPHGLLEDLYGEVPIPGFDDDSNGVADDPGEINWYRGVVAGDLDTTICNGQLVEFTILGGVRRVGAVLTMLTGATAGQSTRIVGISPTNGKCQLLAFAIGKPSAGDGYVLNGTPFSGVGFGFDPATGKLDLADPVLKSPLALLPGAPQNLKAPGGANEDYDAVDFQNMLLGAQIVDTATGSVTTTIPSLHRPELVNYWMNRAADWSTNLELQRRVILRPLPGAHPDFTGSNPGQLPFNPAWNGTFVDQVKALGQPGPDGICDYAWDVDNDGDGLPDGIWVDLGMPVRSTPDGRLYKPLFSILCLDLDGRLNLNAHGCLAQAENSYYAPVDLATPFFAPPIGGPFVFAGSAGPSLPRGQGYGPAEINLRSMFSDVAAYGRFLTSRYQPSPPLNNRDPGNRPGCAWFDSLIWQFDPLSYNKWFEYGGAYWTLMPNDSGAYGAPPNPLGSGAIGLDLAGRPVYCRMGGNDPATRNDEKIDNPYKLNLSDRPAVDTPFTVAELERLLRPFDRDAGGLPNRLAFLLLLAQRHAISTESWDLPCPSVARPKALREVLRAMLLKRGVPEASIPDLMRQLLPPEVLAGLKMDLNRPLGNGRDDNNNGVVDEPGEGVYPNIPPNPPPEQLTLYNRPGSNLSVDFSYDPDGRPGNSLAARQLYARHLYVLLMLLADTDYLEKALGGREAMARFLAQWAVNVVDFYDRDSIMTLFPFDPDPFDAGGWTPPADPRFVVWGCERPELLISETLAFHDRRTEDLSTDSSGKKTTDDPKGSPPDNDDDFDQRWRPQGSLFIELFNPWTTLEPKSTDLYNTPAGGVDLTKVSGGSPVWRLIIVDREEAAKNPDDPSDPPTIERAVYFVRSTVALPPGGNIQFRPDDTTYAAKIGPVMPGRYVVIGPGQPTDKKTSTTYMGFQTGSDPSNVGTSRRIELTPAIDPNTPQVAVFSTGGDTNDLGPPMTIRSATAVVINSPRRLSISEPEDAYDDYTGTGEYNPPLDQPQDATKNPGLWNGTYVKLKDNDTYKKAKVVHLQRLANPLLGYDPLSNPYRTIDASAVDLTSFNGVTNAKDNGPRTIVDEQDNGIEFYTRQRGQSNDQPLANNLWTREPYDQPPKPNTNNVRGDATDHYFDKALHHTLGYLSDPFGLPRGNPAPYVGDPPGEPFPWLTWNNRPFISHLELLLVPLTSSQQLLAHASEFTGPGVHRRFGMAGAGANPYSTPLQPFAHLPDFFHSDKSEPSGNSPQLHRLLEYVGVPSRFVGTELQGNPTVFAAAVGHSFHPPFNLISRYREPGRINLNTIFSEDVWKGLMNFFPDMTTTAGWRWSEFVASRRGYTAANMWDFDARYPTRFAQPFRSFAGGEMVPPISATQSPTLQPGREIDATLLRSQTLLDSATPSNQPLFEYSATQQLYNNTDRNPYFRYQGLQRLGNLVTTRSNVYAIWITVGYFEVEPAATGYDPSVYPDGYRLVQELGIDSGEVKRHRAFYIFDRSIPVGFRRGQDLNVENAVLVERFIE